MSLAPTCAVTLGNLRYDAHVAGIRVDLRALPGVNACTLALPAEVRVDAVPGDTATIEIDGGEGGETVLTGTVRAVAAGLRATRIVAADGSSALAALRPSATYERQSALAVVRALASDAGADVGRVDLDLDLAAYVAGQSRTAAEHVAALADLAGAIATVDADGALKVATPASAADLALRHGRELVSCEIEAWPGPGAAPVPVGFGPGGTPQEPGALRHTLDPLPSGAPDAGPDAVRVAAAVLHAPGVAKSAGTAASRRHESAGSACAPRPSCFRRSARERWSRSRICPTACRGASRLLTGVSHRLDPRRGGLTTLEARAAPGGAGGLAAAAAGAIGGLA